MDELSGGVGSGACLNGEAYLGRGRRKRRKFQNGTKILKNGRRQNEESRLRGCGHGCMERGSVGGKNGSSERTGPGGAARQSGPLLPSIPISSY